MTDPKKEEELGHLKSFLHFCKDVPKGEIISDETPDFIIKSKKNRLGIEITKVFLNPGKKRGSLQGIEAARHRITDCAKKFAVEMGVPPISVTLFFNGTTPLFRPQEPVIAKTVAQAVCEGLPPPGENADLECRYGSVQPTQVDEILVDRAYPVEEHEWKWTEASRVETSAVDYFAKAIAQKAKLIPAIRQKCDECWLLIVAESIQPSGKIRPNHQSLSHTYVSPFDRTYFFDNGMGRLTCLKTTPAPTNLNPPV